MTEIQNEIHMWLPLEDMSGKRLGGRFSDLALAAMKARLTDRTEVLKFAERWIIDNVHGGQDPRASLK
ncbi:hypothetical protein EON82_21835 [bacterium]|nr:MAG: hypothetical protein EON82_21835 [bacterium]